MMPKNREIRAVFAQAMLVFGFSFSVLMSGQVDLSDFGDLALTYLGGAFALWILVGAAMLVIALVRGAPHAKIAGGPVTLLAKLLTERWKRDYFISLLWPPLMFALLMTSFNAFKQMILIRHGFHYDALFAQMDHILFFGHDPWRVTHALLGSPIATLIVDHLYHGWYAPMALGVIVCAWLPADGWRLRTQYLLTYVGIWIGFGSILASLFPAAGPIYYNALIGPNDSFLALAADLRRIDLIYDIRALDLQSMLLSAQGSQTLSPGAGISAMPSVHNALAVLFAIAAFHINKALGWIMAAYAFLIWVGSIHLGWHYAIDGVFSLCLTIGLWKLSGKATDWLELAPRARDSRAQAVADPSPSRYPENAPVEWWESRWLIVAASLASIIPLIYPTVPPLTDVPTHIGRYAIQLGLVGDVHQWYEFKWALIGNLGVDLLIPIFAPIFGLELGAKLLIMAIPALQVTGFLMVAREVHGRIPPTALFAAPLAYSYPFQYGFINFMLSAAFAFIALVYWIRLGNRGQLVRRFWIFIPASCALWLTHTFGFGMFGVLAFTTDLMRNRKSGQGWSQAALSSVKACLGLTLPFIPMILARTAEGGLGTYFWFNWQLKWYFVEMVLRDRWATYDMTAALLLFIVIIGGITWKRLKWGGGLGMTAIIFAALFVTLPYVVFGSAYADMRIYPFALACAILAIGTTPLLNREQRVAIAFSALALFGVRTAGTTVSFAQYHDDHAQLLPAIDLVPRGSRLITFIYKPCQQVWLEHRLEHIASLALIRRGVFVNDQWDLAGSQLLRVKYLEKSGWTNDPSQIATNKKCTVWRQMDEAVRDFPRDKFDYLWIVEKPDDVTIDETGLKPLWRKGNSALYKVGEHKAGGPLPKGDRK